MTASTGKRAASTPRIDPNEVARKLRRRLADGSPAGTSQIYIVRRDVVALLDERDRLRGALRPFAALPVDDFGQSRNHPDTPIFAMNDVAITATDVKAAHAALYDERTGNDPA